MTKENEDPVHQVNDHHGGASYSCHDYKSDTPAPPVCNVALHVYW